MDALSIYWNAVWGEPQNAARRALPAPPPAYSAADLAAFARRRALVLAPSWTAVSGKWSPPRFRVVR
jgi:hypothetical protein